MKRSSVWLPWLAAVGLLVWVLREVSLTAVRQTLQQLHGWQILLLLLLNALVLVLLTGRWWLLLNGLGCRLPFGMTMGHRLAAFGVSYFTPGPHFGGEPVQVLLAEKVHGVPRVTAVSAVSLDKTVELLVNFSFLALGVLVIVQTGLLGEGVGASSLAFPVLLLLFPLLYLGAIWVGKRPLTHFLRLIKPLAGLRQSWLVVMDTAVAGMAASETQAHQLCHQSPGLFAQVLLLSTASWLVMVMEYSAMMFFLGADLSPAQVIAALTAARLAYLLPMPCGLGALEASQVLALSLMGVDPAIGISATLLIRGRDVPLGVLGLWWGSRFVRSTAFE